MKKQLLNWATLNEDLHYLTEVECWALLKAEQKGKKRLQFLLRIYGRANRMRTQRERNELLTPAKR